MGSSFTRVQQGTTASMATGKGKISQANGGIPSELFLTVFDVFEPSHPRSQTTSRDLGERKESPLARILFSYLEDHKDLKTLASFRNTSRAYKNCFQQVKKIFETKKKYKTFADSALFHAARLNSLEDVQILLTEKGININLPSQNNGGATALHTACGNGYTKIVDILLKQPSIDLNAQNDVGGTPLGCASENGCVEIIQLLLKEESLDVNKKNKVGGTALHIATERNQVKVIELLVSHDSTDVNAKNNALATALHIAAIHGLPECANVLLAHPNIEINPLNDIGKTPLYNSRLMCPPTGLGREGVYGRHERYEWHIALQQVLLQRGGV
eukprot:g15351.t1